MKVGEYVRTEKGVIGKINHIDKDLVRVNNDKIITWVSEHKEIVKISPNIIDLIEENDFINQTRVSEIIKKTKDSIRFMADSDYEISTELKEEEIKTILTKEQFESMEYKVGE